MASSAPEFAAKPPPRLAQVLLDLRPNLSTRISMSRSVPPPTMPCPAFRGLALACALLVWVLGLLAASPELHAALHHDADHADHECAVTLFNQGTENPAPNCALVAEPSLTVVAVVAAVERFQIASPQDLLPPGCGPPVR